MKAKTILKAIIAILVGINVILFTISTSKLFAITQKDEIKLTVTPNKEENNIH